MSRLQVSVSFTQFKKELHPHEQYVVNPGSQFIPLNPNTCAIPFGVHGWLCVTTWFAFQLYCIKTITLIFPTYTSVSSIKYTVSIANIYECFVYKVNSEDFVIVVLDRIVKPMRLYWVCG